MGIREQISEGLDKLSGLLFTPEPHSVLRTDYLEDWLDRVSENIASCPKRGRGRTREQVRQSTSAMAIEVALHEALGLPFVFKDDIDHRDESTFMFDAEWRGQLIETKRHSFGWFSFHEGTLRTFRRRAEKLDWFVTARMVEDELQYRVGFKIVAASKYIGDCWMPPQMGSKCSFDQYKAQRQGVAVINPEDYFTEDELRKWEPTKPHDPAKADLRLVELMG